MIRNFDDKAHDVFLKLHFAADFADLFEVRGAQRERRGTLHEPHLQRDQVTLSYTGLDAQRRETIIRFEPAPKELTSSNAVFDLHLEAGQRLVIFVEIQCDKNRSLSSPSKAFFVGLRDARRALRRSSSRAAAIVTSNEILNEGIRRSVSDIYMLLTDTDAGPYPYAGIPLFSTVFGRDAVITALQTLWLDPVIARGVLLYLAKYQADHEDPSADAEPGKIWHEVRHGEMANLGEVPFRCYYGSVDSTPLFIMLAGAYLERTGDIDTIRKIWQNIEAALDWIDRYGDCDGDGFVEYGRKAREGLVNQGWKDSPDSIFHADGSLAKGPIALVEVQAYVYGAWQAAVSMARVLGRHVQVSRLAGRADKLRQDFDDAFWDEDLDTYILALDGTKRPCRVRASNAGHAI
jgi:glycogen debranching enzyme